MTVVLDHNMGPSLKARFATQSWVSECLHLSDVQLDKADDLVVWRWAGQSATLLVTKDKDFAALARHFGAPPKTLLLKTGNATALQTWLDIEKRLLSVQAFLLNDEESLLVIQKDT